MSKSSNDVVDNGRKRGRGEKGGLRKKEGVGKEGEGRWKERKGEKGKERGEGGV